MKDLEKFFSSKNNTAGKIIKSFRENFKITQSELCRITGVGEKYLSSIENDKRPIGLDVASRISVFFGFDPSFLLFPNGVEELPSLYPEIQRGAKELVARKRTSAIK